MYSGRELIAVCVIVMELKLQIGVIYTWFVSIYGKKVCFNVIVESYQYVMFVIKCVD